MTLGMAARSSARKDTGAFSRSGANSLMKIADPTPRGTAMTIAMREDGIPGPVREKRRAEFPDRRERLADQEPEEKEGEEEHAEREERGRLLEQEVFPVMSGGSSHRHPSSIQGSPLVLDHP